MNTFSKKRIEWVDIFRGIVILLVVWAHMVQSGDSAYHKRFIRLTYLIVYSFHMPAFFFISGYMFKAKGQRFSSFIWHKITRLLFPAYCFIVLLSIYDLAYGKVSFSDYTNPINICRTFLFMNNAKFTYWFIGALFAIECFMYFVVKLKGVRRWFICIFTFCVGILFQRTLNIPLPFCLTSSAIIAPLFLLGYEFNQNGWTPSWFISIKHQPYLTVLLAIILLVTNIKDQKYIGVYNANIGNPITYLIKSASGIIILVVISGLIDSIKKKRHQWLRRVLILLGSNTLYIYFLNWRGIGFAQLALYRLHITNKTVGDLTCLAFSLIATYTLASLADETRKALSKRVLSHND